MKIEYWRNWFQALLQDEFNSGYVAGLAVALLVIVLFLLLRLIFAIRYRTRGTKSLTVPSATGDVVIEAGVLIAAVGAITRQFPALTVREVKLFQQFRGRRYLLELCCAFDAQTGDQFPALAEQAKRALFTGLTELFNIRNLTRIKIRLRDFTPPGAPTPAQLALEQKLTPDGKLKFPAPEPSEEETSSDV